MGDKYRFKFTIFLIQYSIHKEDRIRREIRSIWLDIGKRNYSENLIESIQGFCKNARCFSEIK